MIDPPVDQFNRISKKMVTAGEKLEKFQFKSASERNEFFDKLALLIGGAIVVSVTFIGYFLSKQDSIQLRPVLHGGWLLLLVSLLACLLRNFFYQNYAYYSHVEPYLRQLAEKSDIEAKLITDPSQGFVSANDETLLTEAERKAKAAQIKARAQNLRTEADKSARMEKIAARVWRPCEYVVLVTLFLGLSMLVWFAVVNTR